MSPKGSPFKFNYILQQKGCLKAPKGPSFFNLGTMRQFQIRFSLYIDEQIIFLNPVRILEVKVQKICFRLKFLTFYLNYMAFYYGGGRGSKKALPFIPARYIRTSDVIFEL